MADTDSVVTGRLLVVGELCVDLIVGITDDDIRFGQHEEIVPFTALAMGSSSAITACGAAAAGVPTTMVGVVGGDEFGDFIRRELTARGLDVSHVRVDSSRPTGASTHLTRPDGDRAILTAMGTIGHTTADDVPTSFDGASHVHIGSWFLQSALWKDAPALLARARAAGLSTSVDGNFDPEERWDSGILDLLAHADVYFGNDQELAGITRSTDPDAAVESLLDRMPMGAVVVRKLGADGAIAIRHARRRNPCAPARRRARRAGDLCGHRRAGDSLAAGFLAGRLSGLPIDRASRSAWRAAPASTRGPGGVRAQPSRAAAEEIAARVVVRGSDRSAPLDGADVERGAKARHVRPDPRRRDAASGRPFPSRGSLISRPLAPGAASPACAADIRGHRKSPCSGLFLAVTVGFEPTVGGYPTQLFESCTFGRSDTSPP